MGTYLVRGVMESQKVRTASMKYFQKFVTLESAEGEPTWSKGAFFSGKGLLGFVDIEGNIQLGGGPGEAGCQRDCGTQSEKAGGDHRQK